MKNLAPTPKAQAFQLRDVLSEKEAKEMMPKIVEALDTMFLNMDRFISVTNRERATAVIWSNMDQDQYKILAEIIVDGAKKSRILATATEKIVRSHKMLQAGFITVPRFIQTFQFYQQHSGFAFMPMPKREEKANVQAAN